MPKLRQIKFLTPRTLAHGGTSWHWKPSAALRRAGFENRALGNDYKLAVATAIELNDQVEAWKRGGTVSEVEPRKVAPRIVRFGELVRRYTVSPEFRGDEANRIEGLAASTQAEYASRMRALEHWAMDGELPVRDIDESLVRELRNELVRNSSPWRAAAMLRVLRLLLEWAKGEGIIAVNPAASCNIPEPPARKTRMEDAVRLAISEAAVALGIDFLPLAIELGFWLLQRQSDLRHLNRFAWTELEMGELDVAPRHIAALADPRGRVMAYRLAQQKTGTWVDAPVPSHLHEAIAESMRANNSGYVFPHPEDPSRPIPAKTFQRRFDEARGSAWAVAIMDGNARLADAIAACQFRDLRRTGMIFYKTMGAKLPDITALSGHYVLGKRSILDTYMPGDTAGAVTCVATGVLGLRAKEARRQSG